MVSGRFAVLLWCVALGDESCAACATCPRHDGIILCGCCDDTFDEACIGFHGSDPQSIGSGRLPLLENEYDGAIRPVFGSARKNLEKRIINYGDL